MKYFDKYHFLARYIPGIITMIPATMIYFFLTKKFTGFSLNGYTEWLLVAIGFSSTLVGGYMMSMLVRELGSFLEKKYFQSRAHFPTAYLMLHQNDKWPHQIKTRYADKIQLDFGLQCLSHKKEKTNLAEALKILSQAGRMLATKYQQHVQVKDANIAYGLARNVSGGLIISIPLSIAGIVIGLSLHLATMTLWLSVITFMYLLAAIFHKQWIINNAEKYAEKLLSVYLSE